MAKYSDKNRVRDFWRFCKIPIVSRVDALDTFCIFIISSYVIYFITNKTNIFVSNNSHKVDEKYDTRLMSLTVSQQRTLSKSERP